MKRAIVTTTSVAPTEALLKYVEIAKRDGWHMFVAGNRETPFDKHIALNSDYYTYITPEKQEEVSKELSDLIGWDGPQRRNFAILEAFKWGADIIATIDVENDPRDNWGTDCYVGETILVDMVHTDEVAFDPYSATEHSSNLWHRGFPLDLLNTRQKSKRDGVGRRRVLVQEDLIDGDPDIDSICRIASSPRVKFKKNNPFVGDKISPFSALNTFLSREVIREYFIFPGVGNSGDIWASYWLQHKFPGVLAYNRSSAYKPHTDSNHVREVQEDIEGFKHNLEVSQNPVRIFELLPPEAFKAFQIWQELIQ